MSKPSLDKMIQVELILKIQMIHQIIVEGLLVRGKKKRRIKYDHKICKNIQFESS